MTHGGDIYRSRIDMDFSVNINPFGIPGEVKRKLIFATLKCSEYPDIKSDALKVSLGAELSIPQEYLLLGNGASELFMALIHGIRPKKVVIPVPSFYGYEYAADAWGSNITYYTLKEEEGFSFTENFLECLTEDVDLLFFANPNNPTGKMVSKDILLKVLTHCRQQNITVVLDECFIDFTGSDYSLLPEIDEYDNLILVRAFTKIYAIPGVRLGYLICSNAELVKKIQKQLPEWNLSVLAQHAGVACLKQRDYVEKTVEFIKRERQYVAERLEKMGVHVYPSESNFLLIKAVEGLYEKLLDQGILIRDCSDFRGLEKGYYRIAIKLREENDKLLKVIQSVIEG